MHLSFLAGCLVTALALQAPGASLRHRAKQHVHFHKGSAASHTTDVRTADAAVSWVGGKMQCVVPAPAGAALATAVYDNSVNSTGWGLLTVTASPIAGSSDVEVAFAAGCAEAAVTFQEMYAYWNNYAMAEYGAAGPSAKLISFMQQQMSWVRSQLTVNHSRDTQDPRIWEAAALFMAQFDGLVSFENTYVPAAYQLDETLVYMLNSVGDLEDLNNLFPNSAQPGLGATAQMRRDMHASRTKGNVGDYPIPLHDKLTDCSANIRILPDLSDVVVGHTTWRMYYAMLRVYKVYNLSFLPAKIVSFSSSPGLIHSKDDFYVTPQFVTMETTNSVYNQTLFQLYITPKSLFSWQRAYLSNGWAQSGADWVQLFAAYNSGTYNNQWMVVDKKLFVAGQPPPAGFVWIIEQIPGFTAAKDVTIETLNQGNWPSYNIPYLQSIYTMSGYPAMVAKYGAQYTYENCSRATIFRRNASMVENIEELRALLRYNNYAHDPLAGDDPILGSISSRGDLRSPGPVAFGGVDTKVTNMFSMTVLAESGPTYDQQPVFAWANYPSFDQIQHDLVPAVFDFPTIAVEVSEQ